MRWVDCIENELYGREYFLFLENNKVASIGHYNFDKLWQINVEDESLYNCFFRKEFLNIEDAKKYVENEIKKIKEEFYSSKKTYKI